MDNKCFNLLKSRWVQMVSSKNFIIQLGTLKRKLRRYGIVAVMKLLSSAVG